MPPATRLRRESAQRVLRIVYGLNRVWAPTSKRVALRMQALAVKPDRVAERIERALCEPDPERALRLMTELQLDTMLLAPERPQRGPRAHLAHSRAKRAEATRHGGPGHGTGRPTAIRRHGMLRARASRAGVACSARPVVLHRGSSVVGSGRGGCAARSPRHLCRTCSSAVKSGVAGLGAVRADTARAAIATAGEGLLVDTNLARVRDLHPPARRRELVAHPDRAAHQLHYRTQVGAALDHQRREAVSVGRHRALADDLPASPSQHHAARRYDQSIPRYSTTGPPLRGLRADNLSLRGGPPTARPPSCIFGLQTQWGLRIWLQRLRAPDAPRPCSNSRACLRCGGARSSKRST